MPSITFPEHTGNRKSGPNKEAIKGLDMFQELFLVIFFFLQQEGKRAAGTV